MQFNNQLQLFQDERTAQCLRFELKTCLGPCAGNCSRESYRHKVDKAISFLGGRDYSILKRLEERMRNAASQLSFERACVLRDQLEQMKWLHRRIKQLATARKKLDGVWILPGFDRREHWLILRAGQLLDCTGGQTDLRSADVCANARDQQPVVPQTHLDINLQMLISTWMRKHPQQLKSLVKFEALSDSTDKTDSRSVRRSA